MIKIHKELKPNVYLVELEGTKYYQIWNKSELHLHLLKGKNTYNLQVEDLPLPLEELENIAESLTKNKIS